MIFLEVSERSKVKEALPSASDVLPQRLATRPLAAPPTIRWLPGCEMGGVGFDIGGVDFAGLVLDAEESLTLSMPQIQLASLLVKVSVLEPLIKSAELRVKD